MLISNRQYDEAARILQKLVQLPEYHARARLAQANILFAQQKYTVAAEELKKIADPTASFEVSYYVGLCYLEIDKLNLAEAHLEQARMLKPDSAEVYYRLGTIQFQKRDNALAAKHLLQALMLDPEHADAWSLFGSVCLLENAYGDAIPALEVRRSQAGIDPVFGPTRRCVFGR